MVMANTSNGTLGASRGNLERARFIKTNSFNDNQEQEMELLNLLRGLPICMWYRPAPAIPS